jgi:hypothetical protein
MLRLDEGGAAGKPLSLDNPEEELEEIGAVPYLRRHPVSDDDLLRYLCRIAGATSPAVESATAVAATTTPATTGTAIAPQPGAARPSPQS